MELLIKFFGLKILNSGKESLCNDLSLNTKDKGSLKSGGK